MNRDHVLAVLTKHLKLNVHGLDDVTIDPQKPMGDYGASSLDTVEAVSGAMRELDVRIPRKELGQISHLNGLADLFMKFASQAQPT